MQIEQTDLQPLLNPQGELPEPGWSRQPVWQYDRSAISAPWYRIKEWDYFCALSDEQKVGISITISDLSYASLLAVCWIDLNTGTTTQKDLLIPFTRGTLGLDADSQSSQVRLRRGGWTLDYQAVEKNHWQLSVSIDAFMNQDSLNATLSFRLPDEDDTLNIASSWAEQRTAFYYNRKINGLSVEGTVLIGDQQHRFESPDTLGTLDWGRGVWTYRNRWYWASANGWVDGKRFGLNLGYGFSDRSHGSENAMLFDGQLIKLDDLRFGFNEHDYLQPWTCKSRDGILRFTFTPIVDRESHTNFLVIKSDQHQVFGSFSGTFTLPDGSEKTFSNVLGFAEDVFNKF